MELDKEHKQLFKDFTVKRIFVISTFENFACVVSYASVIGYVRSDAM